MLIRDLSTVAGVGHRPSKIKHKGDDPRLPKAVIELQKDTSIILEKFDIILRHGDALGSDRNWSSAIRPENNHRFTPHGFIPDWAFRMVHEYHPAPYSLNPYSFALHARNMLVILGMDGKDPVDLVLAHTVDGQYVGGTATALRCAEDHNIDILNTGYPEQFHFLERMLVQARYELELKELNRL